MFRRLSLLAGVSLLSAAPATAQVAITRIGDTFSPAVAKSSLTIDIQEHDWVVDIGLCAENTNCIENFVDPVVGAAKSFDFLASDTLQQGDVAMGEGHWASSGSWDLSSFGTYNFTFRDRNAPGLYHYALMYDDRKCYRQWLFNHTDWNNGHQLESGAWYNITANLGNTQFTDYYTQDGASAACYDPNAFNLGSIKYIEFGIFGPAVELSAMYGFDIGGQIIFGTADVAALPEPASWALMLFGFGLAGSQLRRRRVTQIV